MTFRIFQVSADGVASPVYDPNAPEKPMPTSTAATSLTTGASTTVRDVPVEGPSGEWEELRERLRQQANPKPVRKTLLGL